MTVNKSASNVSWIDENDEVGDLTDEWFTGATLRENGVVKRRPGQRGPGTLKAGAASQGIGDVGFVTNQLVATRFANASKGIVHAS